MFGITPLILAVLPLLLQLILGTTVIFKSKPFNFKTVVLTNIVLQIALGFASFYIANANFSSYFEEHPNATRCGMPLIGIMSLILFSAVLFFLVIIIQYLIKRWRNRKITKTI